MNPFDYDLLLINQRALALAERYDVLDLNGAQRFHVHRMLQPVGMFAAGIVRMALFIGGLYFAFQLLMAHEYLWGLAVLWLSGRIGDMVFLLLAPFRHIYIYSVGYGEEHPILTISQDTKIALWRRFTLFDDLGQPVAKFQKDLWTNFYRRRWRVFTPDGVFICALREDDWLRSILRRVIGNPFGLLNTTFNFEDSEGYVMGVYSRRWTILDRYILDLREDAARRLDRRAALAAGILLDTGERR